MAATNTRTNRDEIRKVKQTILIDRLTEPGKLLRISPVFQLYAQVSKTEQGIFVSIHWKETQNSAVYFTVKANDSTSGLNFNEEISIIHSSSGSCYQMKKASFPGRVLVLPFLLSGTIRIDQVREYRLIKTRTGRWGMTLII